MEKVKYEKVEQSASLLLPQLSKLRYNGKCLIEKKKNPQTLNHNQIFVIIRAIRGQKKHHTN